MCTVCDDVMCCVVLSQFQEIVYKAVKESGWDGKDDHDQADLQWSFAGSLLFAVTVITTIGIDVILLDDLMMKRPAFYLRRSDTPI